LNDSSFASHRLHEKIIEDEKVFVRLCKILGDKISLGIMKSTMKVSKSAVEISKEYHLPQSSVYKKIQKLQDLGILKIQAILADDVKGKKIAYYGCTIKSLEMNFDEQGHTKIALQTIDADQNDGRYHNNNYNRSKSKNSDFSLSGYKD
jgi:predicted transcriptional regulator